MHAPKSPEDREQAGVGVLVLPGSCFSYQGGIIGGFWCLLHHPLFCAVQEGCLRWADGKAGELWMLEVRGGHHDH